MRVLLLGGTSDARDLAEVLRAADLEVIESLAGRTAEARASEQARVGGFGGVAGLANYLQIGRVDAVVDATHPFAATISGNAAAACRSVGVRLIRLERPGWTAHPWQASWTWVPDHEAAAQAVGCLGPGRVLLTVGRQSLDAYAGLPDVVARVAEWQGDPVPTGWRILEDRGPFELAEEIALLRTEQVIGLVSKDSGGEQTAAKLDAAHSLGVPVIMVQRPEAPRGVLRVATSDAVLAWLGAA